MRCSGRCGLRLFLLALLAALTTAVGAGGCGADDEPITAEELVDELNANGAEVELRERLEWGREGAESYDVEVGPGGGSLIVTETPEAGLAEYERCERAATLLCFRAANVALLVEDEVPPVELARLEAAFSALAR